MERNKKINWGIIGCGKIADKFAQSLQIIPDASLHGVASKSKERAESFAGKFRVPFFYDSYMELIKNEEIDVIYIATTHNFHYENTMLCLENGKAVLCEKPLTVNAEQTQNLIETSRNNDLFLMEAFWTRFIPSTIQLMQFLSQKTIGDIRLIKADFGYDFPFDPMSRVFNPELAGGALLDVGIYPVNFARMIFRMDPIEVISTASLSETGVDEQSAYVFRYETGAIAILNSAVNVSTRHDAWIYGTRGYIHMPKFYCAEKLYISDYTTGKTNTFHLPFESTGYSYEAIETMNCIREGKIESDIMPHEESLRIMKIMDKMRASWGLKYPEER